MTKPITTPAEAIERSARILRKRQDDYHIEHGRCDFAEYPGNGEDLMYDWEEIEQAILALSSQIAPPPAPVVKVKPLVWAGVTEGEIARDGFGLWYFLAEGGEQWMHCDGHVFLNGGKAAAQADYEARILAAIELTPGPVAPVAADDIAVKGAGSWDELIADALKEAGRAMQKFPQPNYVISKVAEESGEVVKAAIHCAEGRESYENLRGEMKQLIAMLYRLWVEGDQVHGLQSVGADK